MTRVAGTRHGVRLAVLTTAMAGALSGAAPHAAASDSHAINHIASTDYCADQFVLGLARDGAALTLSPDAARDFSYLRDRAAGHRRARPEAETIYARQPDIVLSAWGGNTRRLERLGLTVMRLPYASSLDDIEATILLVADALGERERGAKMHANFRARRQALAARAARQSESPPIRALYATPGGVTAGRGTLVHEIMTLAGVQNLAGARTGWPPLPAERLIAAPPDLIIAGFFDTDAARADHWSLARHPALAHVFRETPTLHLPADVLACPAWFILDAAEAIADHADTLRQNTLSRDPSKPEGTLVQRAP